MSSNDVHIFSHFFILFRLFDHTVVGQRDRSISCPICKVANQKHKVGAEFNMGLLDGAFPSGTHLSIIIPTIGNIGK